MLQLVGKENDAGPSLGGERSAEAIAHELRNMGAVRRALKQGHKSKCGMICTAIKNGLTDAEVIEHLAVQNLETTIKSVRTLRRDLRKVDASVMTNTQAIAIRGAF